jgi:hypothetical protein
MQVEMIIERITYDGYHIYKSGYYINCILYLIINTLI